MIDTIAAVATGAGRAGIGVVRVSGPAALDISQQVLGEAVSPRTARYGAFLDGQGETLDVGIAIVFEAPHSFTGEHVLELQGHGGPVVMDRLLQRVCSLGARPARPGEFSERAFLNDKLDLAQAEAIADLIDASTEGAARAAVRAMRGEFSQDVDRIVEQLLALRVWLEAALDFSEEEIDFLSDASLIQRADDLLAAFDRVLQRASQGQKLRDGLHVAIAGLPNVGKSSLMNALVRADAAIVTDVPGTTRDVLREDIEIDNVPIRLVDTAGLRDTDDRVERIGIDRAHAAITEADLILLVADASAPEWPDVILPDTTACLRIHNKVDLASTVNSDDSVDLQVSALTGQGMDRLREYLVSASGSDASVEGVYLARRRHLSALQQARQASAAAVQRLRTGGDLPELAAEELREAQRALEAITGRFDADDLLGEIFGSFCIGK